MFDVLMYLFETYIHNEAEMGVDQDYVEHGMPSSIGHSRRVQLRSILLTPVPATELR